MYVKATKVIEIHFHHFILEILLTQNTQIGF